MSTSTEDVENAASIALPSRSRPVPSIMKSHRILACVQCQHRKIKCNREFPCSHCTKTGVDCVPGNLVPRQRRRRFAERELLDRLRHYEDLLNQHNIEFEPLHPSSSKTKEDSSPPSYQTRDDPATSASPSLTGSTASNSINIWSALSLTPSADDEEEHRSESDSDFSVREMGERMIKKAWMHSNYRKEDLIFGTPLPGLDFTALHPPPAQIFKLWQVYLDNVDPLLKVTHTPTLQPRLIDATGRLSNVDSTLTALMFGIYCISVVSLTEEESWTMFAASKNDLLGRFQFGCQQALLHSAFLRTEDLDCLTAMYLYMISMKPDIDARSLSSSLGLAVRIAQRMGLHDESTYGRCSVLEAELRRRLWWSLVIFDNRMCEMSNCLKATLLLPTWDCRVPSNINDFDLRVETKTTPRVGDAPGQAIFAAVRSQIADYVRHSHWYLNFNTPALKTLSRKNQPAQDVFEEYVEEQYLQRCNPEDPLHAMTIWTARGLLAKNRMWDHLSKFPRPSIHQTDSERDIGVSRALRIIECDTKLFSSTATRRFQWYTKTFSFFPAYIHIVQDLRKRPLSAHAPRAWTVMSEDWEARHHGTLELQGNPFFTMFSRNVMQAWEAREAALLHRNLALEPLPGIVAEMQRKMKRKVAPDAVTAGGYPGIGAEPMDINIDDFLMNLMPMPIDFANQQAPYGFGPSQTSISR